MLRAERPRRHWFALAALILALGLGAAQATGSTGKAGTHRTLAADCRRAEFKPRQLMFACADGGYYVNRLTWESWHPFKARGRGLFHQNDCKPSCAGGEFHEEWGTLVLRHRQWCKKIHRYVYKFAHVHYDESLLGESDESFKLYCPF